MSGAATETMSDVGKLEQIMSYDSHYGPDVLGFDQRIQLTSSCSSSSYWDGIGRSRSRSSNSNSNSNNNIKYCDDFSLSSYLHIPKPLALPTSLFTVERTLQSRTVNPAVFIKPPITHPMEFLPSPNHSSPSPSSIAISSSHHSFSHQDSPIPCRLVSSIAD